MGKYDKRTINKVLSLFNRMNKKVCKDADCQDPWAYINDLENDIRALKMVE